MTLAGEVMDIKEFRKVLQDGRPYFYQFPWPVVTYLHWTAGRYFTTFREYHFCIDGDGEIIYTRPLDVTPVATWKRNTGSIAIALCCCYNGAPDNLGEYPPTTRQIEICAEMMAAISDVFGVPIDAAHFMTHGEAADIDGYGLYSGDSDCRWDLHILEDGQVWGTGGDILRGKAAWYLS